MNRIRKTRKELGYSQAEVARYLHISQSAYSQWETGQVKRMDAAVLQRLAELFGTTVEYLISRDKTSEIPVLGRVAAGLPIEAYEDFSGDTEKLSEAMAADEYDYFALRIRGDSMSPQISNGDTVIVRKQSDVESGQVGIVLLDGMDATAKQVQKTEQGLVLVSFNPAYPPRLIPWADVANDVQVIGRVVELRRKF